MELNEYKVLEEHQKKAQEWHMRDLFKNNPRRFEEFRYVVKAYNS